VTGSERNGHLFRDRGVPHHAGRELSRNGCGGHAIDGGAICDAAGGLQQQRERVIVGGRQLLKQRRRLTRIVPRHYELVDESGAKQGFRSTSFSTLAGGALRMGWAERGRKESGGTKQGLVRGSVLECEQRFRQGFEVLLHDAGDGVGGCALGYDDHPIPCSKPIQHHHTALCNRAALKPPVCTTTDNTLPASLLFQKKKNLLPLQ
jgi:hypothetical protein